MRAAEVLAAASDLTSNERREQWGDPAHSLNRIAVMWTAILDHNVQPHEVALCMTALKIVRASHSPTNVDSWIDIAGYAGIGSESV